MRASEHNLGLEQKLPNVFVNIEAQNQTTESRWQLLRERKGPCAHFLSNSNCFVICLCRNPQLAGWLVRACRGLPQSPLGWMAHESLPRTATIPSWLEDWRATEDYCCCCVRNNWKRNRTNTYLSFPIQILNEEEAHDSVLMLVDVETPVCWNHWVISRLMAQMFQQWNQGCIQLDCKKMGLKSI